MPKELADLELHLHQEGERAIQVSENGDRTKAVWLPKSQIEYEVVRVGLARAANVTLPLWLAREKGLV